MDDINRNTEIGLVYEHLAGAEKPPQSLLTEVSNLKKLENPVTEGEYADYRYQVITDEKFVKLYPEIMAVLTKLQFVPTFAPKAQQDAARKVNDALCAEVVELIVKYEIAYVMMNNIEKELGGNVFSVLKGAVNAMNNRAGDALMDIARKHFDTEDVHMGHIQAYVDAKHAEAGVSK